MQKNPIVYSTEHFDLEVPLVPFVSREEGGHLRIMSKFPVSDRTKLSRDQAIEYTKLSMMAGEALVVVMARSGVEVGVVNYQEMGNWMVFKPGGPVLHMHIFGRAVSATIQKYGEAVVLPQRDTGFYDNFAPLTEVEMQRIGTEIERLAASEKYSQF